jgi:hypothetical protein
MSMVSLAWLRHLESIATAAAGDDEVVEIASLEVDAVHPPPDEAFPFGALEFGTGVVLAPGAAEVPYGLAVVREKRRVQDVDVDRHDRRLE